MTWFRLDPAIILDDPAISDALDPRSVRPWLTLWLTLHRRFPAAEWWRASLSDASTILGRGRPYRGRIVAAELVSLGLLSEAESSYVLPPRYRMPGPDTSAVRTRLYRHRHANTTPTERPHAAHTRPEESLKTNELQQNVTLHIDIREQCSEIGVDSKSGALKKNPPASPPHESASDDLALPEWSTTEPDAFVLTSPSGNGNGNGNHSSENTAAIFKLWQSLPGLEHHRVITGHYDAITRGIQRWGYIQLSLAITRYSEIMTGDYWHYSWSLRDLITRKQGQWIERLISDDYREHFRQRKPEGLDSHYKRLLGRA